MVAFSVIVQGALVPSVARWCRVPMQVVDPAPWALGMRFRHQPTGTSVYRVASGAPADGLRIAELPKRAGCG
ncbi:hypothetical protein ACQP2P_25870 [Dactylosporangium sp. CA-139114]|uniref:hypothetical protein n=1 Tax=Dactylosporangium sp. CA-139114 TaxID=3239931 RepID=UPI003D964436